MRNYPEWMLIYWACLASGITAVGFNAWWTAEEMAYTLGDSRPLFLFVDDERLDRAREALSANPQTQLIGVRTERETPGGLRWDSSIMCRQSMQT